MNQISPKSDLANNLSDASDEPPTAKPRGRSLFLLLRIGLLGVLIAVMGLWAWDWARTAILFVHETDARVMADMISVSSRVSGQIEKLPVTDGQTVQKGDLVISLESQAAGLRLRELEAELNAKESERASIEAEIRSINDSVAADVLIARASMDEAIKKRELLTHRLDYASSEFKRARSLAASGTISASRLDKARTDNLQAQQEMIISDAEIESARAAIMEAEARVSEIAVERSKIAEIEAAKLQIMARIDRQKYDIEERVVKSPVDGVVSDTFVSVGEFIAPGQRIAMIHDPDKIWIQSNIRETDISRVKPGQSVRIEVDAYPDEVFTGTVERIGHAATSQFALLPRLNNSGNFTKVTQRLEVRIAIDQRDGKLKPGMMVEVFIDAEKKNLF